KKAQKAQYQKKTTSAKESQNAMLEKLELTEEHQKDLFKYAKEKNLSALSSPFDIDSAIWLIEEMGLQTIKIGSGEITNGPLLFEIARRGTPIILSTGMSTLGDIENALAVIAFGYRNPKTAPNGIEAIKEDYHQPGVTELLAKKVSLLHCTTEYPAPFDEVNLRAMKTLRNAFSVEVGFSDHTPGIVAPIAAVALGATIIEKHFTLDNDLPGPDHKASLNPKDFQEMVTAIRKIEVALGDGVKKPSASEVKNKNIARKSLVCQRNIDRGESFSADNLTCKRPGEGVSPMLYWDYLGKTSASHYQSDELIK
ncbi:MAG: N-acetylneuraminate synthase family protein, partial [Pseudomonadota bacterium]